jgi:hypothetical protein
MRRAARADGTQPAIIAALEAAGAGVDIVGRPLDLIVSYAGAWAWFECKASRSEAGRKTKTRERQLAFAARHPGGGPIFTVWTVVMALDALKAMRGTVTK